MYNEDGLIYEAQQNEQMIIGLMLASRPRYYEIRNKLDIAMFTDAATTAAFRAIMKVEKENLSIDVLSVANMDKELDSSQLLSWVTSYLSVHIDTDSIVESMRRSMKRRKLISLMQQVGTILSDKSLPSQVIDSYVGSAYDKYASEAGTMQDAEHISVSVDQVYDEYSQNAEHGVDAIPGLATGFKALDNCIGGMQEGNLIVVGGGTSIGKTAFALNIAQSVAERGKKVFIVSLEMNAKENTKRFLSAYSSIPANKISLPSVWESMGKANILGDVFESIGKLPIRYLCSGDGMPVNIARIRTTAMAMKVRGGLDLIIVDYLQLLDSNDSKSTNDAERLSKISRGLKMLAMSLNVPVIALAQLNREASKGDRPRMSQFKGSSSIEQDANVGILLHRNKGNTVEECHGDYFDPNLKENHTRVFVDKNRNGMTSEEITLKFNKATTTFYE